MNWVTAIVVYVMLWWIVLFCVLPIGVQPVAELEKGHDAGAPANPRLWFKILLTTGISLVAFGAFYLIATSNLISFRTR